MSNRGRKRTGKNILALRAGWRAETRDGSPKPFALERTPYAPKWLGPVGKEEWNRIVGELVELSILSELDLTILATYCSEVERYRDAIDCVREFGTLIKTYTTPRGEEEPRLKSVVKNPAIGIAARAASNIRSLASELGISPAARSNVKVTTRDVDDDDQGGADGDEKGPDRFLQAPGPA